MVVVRDATRDDLPAITAIYNAFLETTTHEWTETPHTVTERVEWLARKQNAGRPALVAVDGDVVVGWATYGDFRDTDRWPGYLPTVALDPRSRGLLGARDRSRLIDALVEQARSEGKHVMVAGIDSENVGSIRFHERLGFVEAGRLRQLGVKFGRRLDLVLMQRMLDEPTA